jgi:hypothetical protein
MSTESEVDLKDKSKIITSLGESRQGFFTKLQPIVITIISLQFFLSAFGFFLTLPTAKRGRVDFRSFYTVGYMARTGRAAGIYDPAQYRKLQDELVGPADATLPFNHLAYESLIFVPFSFLSYPNAYFAFLIVNLMILAALTKMLQPLFSPLAELWSLLPLALVPCFLPVTMSLIEGQDSLLLLLLFVAAAISMTNQKHFQAGVLLGLALFKFQYALPIAFLFVVWKRWRFLAGFATSALIVLSLSFWLTGFSGAVAYIHSVLEVSARFSAAHGVLYGVHPEGMPNFRGLAAVISGTSALQMHLITFGLSALILVWAAFKPPSLPSALLAAMLVSYHQVIADTSLLALPLGLYLSSAISKACSPRLPAVAIALVTFVAPTALLFAGTRFYLLVFPILVLFVLFDRTYGSQKNSAQAGGMSTNGDPQPSNLVSADGC